MLWVVVVSLEAISWDGKVPGINGSDGRVIAVSDGARVDIMPASGASDRGADRTDPPHPAEVSCC